MIIYRAHCQVDWDSGCVMLYLPCVGFWVSGEC